MIASALAAAVVAGATCLDDARRGQLVVLGVAHSKVTAVIDPAHGGNLVGLETDGRELLYRGLDFCPTQGWDGKAPLLWPATGRNYAGDPVLGEASFGWNWQGHRYPMPIHGFARDQAWRVVRRSAASVTLELGDTPASREAYPFGFRLRMTYRLAGDTLAIDHAVRAAKGQSAMPFSIGNHATFNVAPGAWVSTGSAARVTLDAAGRPSGQVAQAPLTQVPVATFDRLAAYAMVGYPEGAARARLDLGDGIAVDFTQAASGPAPVAEPIRYNLWGDPAAGYYAVEPWYGRQNSLADGAGVVRLPAGQRFSWQLLLTISRQGHERGE